MPSDPQATRAITAGVSTLRRFEHPWVSPPGADDEALNPDISHYPG
jgi:hypothetical protein